MTDREKFEEWATDRKMNVAPGLDGYDFQSMNTEMAWLGFQAALSSRDSTPTEGVDRALAAPRMTLDLRGVFRTGGGAYYRDSLLPAIRAQLPNVDIITDKETP